MSTYPGGLITLNPPTTTGPGGIYNDGGTASGMWRLDQALVKQKQSLWPTKSKTKQIWGWGDNSYGRLGDGVRNTNLYRSSPVQVTVSGNWANWSLGSIATQSNGTLWVWGRNNNGALGINQSYSGTFYENPVQLDAATNWGTSANMISTGYAVGKFAIKTTGTLWSWGAATQGITGQNNTNSISSPVQIGTNSNWAQVACSGFRNAGAITTSGSLYMWGQGNYGGNGDSFGVERSSPVQISGTWSFVSPGYRCAAALKSDNTLWTWGHNGYGQLGDVSLTHRSSPAQVAGSWLKISMSNQHCLGIKTGGTLWSWGFGQYGRLGANNYINRSSPTQVGVLTTWTDVKAMRNYSAAISDGKFFAWGNNSQGQLGQNAQGGLDRRSSPVQVGIETDWAVISANSGSAGLGGVRAF